MKESQPKYIVTQDTLSLFERINRNELSGDFLVALNYYFDSIQRIISENFDQSIKVVGFKEEDISKKFTKELSQELLNDDVYCICLDRYLLADIEQKNPDRFFRFSITRTTDGGKRPRCGDPSFMDQLQQLKNKIPNLEKMRAVIVDDGIFTGGTVREMVDLLNASGNKINVKRIIGFIGSEDKNNGIKILESIDNLFEWVDIRDFSPFAGKVFAANRNNRVATAIPYLFPWSYGEGASFDKSPNLLRISRNMILEFQKLVTSFEKNSGMKIRFRDLVKLGFTLPVSDKKTIPISINDTVTEYLNRCLEKIDSEEKRKVVVFDMDGTLYRLDGLNGGYSGSSLEAKVKENALKFIKNRENCSDTEAQKIYDLGVADKVGLSQFLSERYGISRPDYFNVVWNIDPSSIVKGYEISRKIINELQKTDAKLILLTSAPRVWAQKVIEFLNLNDAFELTFSGESFGNKDEIFNILSGRYKPTNILSVGDQEKTDIIPAKKLGCNTLLVGSPSEVTKILTITI